MSTPAPVANEAWEARRDAAIAFFDRQIGAGWQDRVELARLDIEDGACCIAGQVFGGYDTAETTAQMVLGITDEQWMAADPSGKLAWERWGIDHAFLSDDTLSIEALTWRWRTYLAAAQMQAAPA